MGLRGKLYGKQNKSVVKKAVEWRFLSPVGFLTARTHFPPHHENLPRALSPPPFNERVYFVKFTPPRGGGLPRPFFRFFFYHRLKKNKSHPLFFTTALAALLKRWSQRSGSRTYRPCVEQVTAKAGAVVKRTRVPPPETRNQTNRGPRSRRCGYDRRRGGEWLRGEPCVDQYCRSRSSLSFRGDHERRRSRASLPTPPPRLLCLIMS